MPLSPTPHKAPDLGALGVAIGNEVVLSDHGDERLVGALALATRRSLVVHSMRGDDWLAEPRVVGCALRARCGDLLATGTARRTHRRNTLHVDLDRDLAFPDRRHAPRVRAVLEVRTQIAGVATRGQTVDVSRSGARLWLRAEVLVGQRLVLAVIDPTDPTGPADPIRVEAVVLATSDGEGRFLRVCFCDRDAEATARLDRLVSYLRTHRPPLAPLAVEPPAVRRRWRELRPGAVLENGHRVLTLARRDVATGSTLTELVVATVRLPDGRSAQMSRRADAWVVLAPGQRG
jgi:hypothetical protein